MKKMVPKNRKSLWRTFMRTSVATICGLAIAASSFVTDGNAQDVLDTPLWKKDVADGSWFANDNNTRGFAYNKATGNLLVVSRSGGLKVVVLSAATGDSLGVLDVTGIAGGTFPLSLIDVAPNGRIFAANLTTNATTGAYKIYTWENEAATPVVAYEGDVNATAFRFGDSFRVDFTDGAMNVYGGGTSNPNLAQFTFDEGTGLLSVANVFNFGEANNTTMRAVRGIAPIAGQDSLWINEFAYTLKKMSTATGALGTVVPASVFPTQEALWTDYADFGGKKLVGVFPTSLVASGQSASIVDLETGAELAYTAAGPNGNANATGGPLFDVENNRMYLMATNNHIAAYDISAYTGSSSDEVSVTFTLNTSTIPDTVRAEFFKMHVNGAIKGVGAGQSFLDGETLDWGSTATAVLTSAGGDYWTGTFRMNKGDTLLYKYRWSLLEDADRTADERGFANSENPAGWDTRSVIPDGDVVLPVDFWNAKSGNPSQADQAPFVSHPDSIALFFRVNVGAAEATGAFNPDTDVVGVRGMDPIFDWGTTKLILERETMPEGSRNVMYSGALRVPLAMAGDPVKWKFVYEITHINPRYISWDNGNDAFNPDNDGNNQSVVGQSDTTYAFKFYEGRRPPSAPVVEASLQFAVNVGVLEGLGLFNRVVGDSVTVPGGFNNWNSGAPMAFNETFDAWTAAYNIKEEVGATVAYKYFIKWHPSRVDTESPNYIPNIPTNDAGDPVGWEEPGIAGGGNRFYTYTDETIQTVTDGDEDVAFYNGVPPYGVISETSSGNTVMPVRFVIDMSPALNHTSPFDPATDEVFLVIQTPIWALTQELPEGDQILNNLEARERVKFSRTWDPFRPFEYELIYEMALPADNHIGFAIAYVKPDGSRVINGGGFDAGRRHYRYVYPEDSADRDNVLWPDNVELKKLVWKLDNLDYEAPLCYCPDDPKPTSVDEPVVDTANEFALMQNYPNPFNPATTISFTLPESANVTLTVYNVLGQRVATLVNNQVLSTGLHRVSFDAARLSSGVYIYELRAGSFVQQKTMMLVK